MLGFAQLMMRETEIVGASDQIHARLKRFEAMSGMTRAAGQARQPLPERSIQAFNKRGVEDGTPLRTLQQLLGLRQQTMSHAPRDLDDPFFLRSLDHGCNHDIRPCHQAGSSSAHRLFHFLAQGPPNAARIGRPPIRADQQRTQWLTTGSDLGQQAICQLPVARDLDHPS